MNFKPSSNALNVQSVGTGPDLVLLHGWGANSAVWQLALQRWQHNYCVHRVDLPGYGFNHQAANSNFDESVQRIAAVIPDQATVIAWSMSGLLATAIANLHPGKIARLVYVCSSPCFVKRDDWNYGLDGQVFGQFASELHQNHAATLTRFLALQTRGSTQASETLKALRKACLRTFTPSVETLELGLSWLKCLDLRRELAVIEQPILFVFGQYDTIVRPRLSQALQTLVPKANYALIAGSAHAPFISHADEFCNLTARFLVDV